MSIAPTAQNDNRAPSNVHLTSFTGNNEWFTPGRYVELAREVLGTIDLDPASNDFAQQTVRATKYHTAETNGLDKPWSGNVWVNPPYSRDLIGRFVDKVVGEYTGGSISQAIVLTHNTTDTAWFGKLFRFSSALCFTTGRVRFVSPEGKFSAPPQGQAFTYFGPHVRRFHEVFSQIGNVVFGASADTALREAA